MFDSLFNLPLFIVGAAILVLLWALFIGLIISVIFALDRPFRGDLGFRPYPYQLIYDQLMKR